MPTEVIVLGDGTGGLVTSNLLARQARRHGVELRIRLIGRSPVHTYQPGLLFLPFRQPGYRAVSDIQRRTEDFVHKDVDYVVADVSEIDPEGRTVATGAGTFRYDWLVLALGCRTVLDDIEGLAERWGRRVHGFYTPDSAMRLADALDRFEGGDLVIDIADMPIKCPVAPLEFACLADAYLRRRGLRESSRLTLVTPLNGAFTKPVCNEVLTHLLVRKGISVVPNAPLAKIDDKVLACPDGNEVAYDLLVTIPPHEGSDLIEDAGLGDGLGFGVTDRHTLKSRVSERIFLLGDNTNVPTSKAGSVAHFQAEVVVHNLLREIAGEEAEPMADGHANCFIETGGGKAVLIDFNYEVQPLPGRFPVPVLGPLSLLRESRLNHLGKLMFRSIYWNMLLPGRPIPLVASRMSMAGKHAGVLAR